MEKLNGLRCRECGRRYPANPIHVCEFCFGPLEVDYRYDALKTVVTRASIAAGPPSMWRYRDLLPIEGDAAVAHHVGFTPLIRAQNLAEELGCREVWIKNDSVCHPSWSFKDRVVAVAVTKALEFGFDTVACASTGNLANSVAAHAAEGRLKSYIFIPADLEQGQIVATLVYSPTLVAVHGYYRYTAAKESVGAGEHATDEEIVEGMLLLARTEVIFTETAGGVTIAAAKKLIERGVIPRDESIVICVTGNGLKTPDALQDRLETHVKIKPSLSAFDRALAELKSQTS